VRNSSARYSLTFLCCGAWLLVVYLGMAFPENEGAAKQLFIRPEERADSCFVSRISFVQRVKGTLSLPIFLS
jgi:hypothetical protein